MTVLAGPRYIGRGFGELALLTRAPRTATATAVEATALACFDGKAFGRLLDESPAVSRRLLEATARRLREHDATTIQ